MAELEGVVGIPGPFRGVFLALEALEDEEASKLVDSFTKAAGFQRVAALQDLTRSIFPPEQELDAERLVPALLSLLGQLRGTPPQRIAEAVSEATDFDSRLTGGSG